MAKAPQAYQTIGEAARTLSLPTHVLRFWETKFPTLKPRKGPGGRRYYSPQDMQVLVEIRTLLQDERYTLKGAQMRLGKKTGEQTGEQVAIKPATPILPAETAKPATPTMPTLATPSQQSDAPTRKSVMKPADQRAMHDLITRAQGYLAKVRRDLAL